MQKLQKIISLISIVALLGLYGFIPITRAASLTAASDTLSTSDLNVSATHTISFTTHTALIAGDYFNVIIPDAFSSGVVAVGNITCPTNSTASVVGTTTAQCTATAGLVSGVFSIKITGVSNPGVAGSQSIAVSSQHAGGVIIEQTAALVAIISKVAVSASVPSSLTFAISPLDSGSTVNGTDTTVSSATTTLAFGTLTVGTSSVMGQELRVTTNANNGFVVTVHQDQNLTSNAGSVINSFKDAVVGAPQAWAAPTGVLDDFATYGHLGLTTDDSSLSTGDPFGGNLWRGFATTTPVEVMYHNGPSDGLSPNKGDVRVAYQIQISALQAAGDYTNSLTYVATPTY